MPAIETTLTETLSHRVEALIGALNRLREQSAVDTPEGLVAVRDVCLATRTSWTSYLDHWRLQGRCEGQVTQKLSRALDEAHKQVGAIAKKIDAHRHPYIREYVKSIEVRREMFRLLLTSGLTTVDEEYARRVARTEERAEKAL